MYTPTQSYGLFQSTRPHGARHDDAADTLTGIVVSIHAPTRGATPLSCGLIWRHLVSIHAPTRGATSKPKHVQSMRKCFNPRAHTGRDVVTKRRRHPIRVSIHAPTRGATYDDYTNILAGLVSIHAPTRGATPYGKPSGRQERVSIHAPTRGATCSAERPMRNIFCFNPRAHTGRD